MRRSRSLDCWPRDLLRKLEALSLAQDGPSATLAGRMAASTGAVAARRGGLRRPPRRAWSSSGMITLTMVLTQAQGLGAAFLGRPAGPPPCAEAARSQARLVVDGLRAWSPDPSSPPKREPRRARFRRACSGAVRTRTAHASPASAACGDPCLPRGSATEGRATRPFAWDIPIQKQNRRACVSAYM